MYEDQNYASRQEQETNPNPNSNEKVSAQTSQELPPQQAQFMQYQTEHPTSYQAEQAQPQSYQPEPQPTVSYQAEQAQPLSYQPEPQQTVAYQVEQAQPQGYQPEPQQTIAYQVEQAQPLSYQPEPQQTVAYQAEQAQPQSYQPEPQPTASYQAEQAQPQSYQPEPQPTASYQAEQAQPLSYQPEPQQTASYQAEQAAAPNGAKNHKIHPLHHDHKQHEDKSQREKKNRSFGLSLALIIACCALSLAAGFGGGIWAANQVGERVTADMQAYLEESGSTVLYRSVSTDEENSATEEELGSIVTNVANLAADSVVEISTEVLTDNFYSFFGMGGPSITQGAGSGVILSDDGYILTCYHVIDSATTIGVTLRDGTQYEATLIGGDEELDIAVIKIEASDLTPAVLGSSGDLVVGSPVVAIGNPLGQLGGTVTSGYISALDRVVTIEDKTYNVMQTDAAINGGNSGGGLFNASGELVGLVNAKAESIGVEGLGFAIPIDDISQDIEDLITYGYITSRVTLGITMVNINDQRTALAYRVEEFGVYILNVSSGSNAEYAGLQPGDRIVSIDGETIENGDQVVDIISTYSVGEVMNMVISRNGTEIPVQITMYGAINDPSPSTPVSNDN